MKKIITLGVLLAVSSLSFADQNERQERRASRQENHQQRQEIG